MNIFCPNLGNTCPDPASPINNYSSEADDGVRFFSRNYGTWLFPPIGSPWRSPSCVGECVSLISQADADACAQRANLTCLGDEWPPADPPGTPRLVFLNDAQSCDFTCPDGLVFTYTVPAGTFAGFSQAEADAIADSTACNRAIQHRVCLSTLSPETACAGQSYSGVITATGPEIPTSGNVWEVVSGALPTGMTLSSGGGGTATIAGTAGAEASYSFSIRMTKPNGDQLTKAYKLCVIGKTALDDGTVGTAYSETLTDLLEAGCPDSFPLSWQITSGSLPTGLTLNESTGIISGTPTVAGTFIFVVLLQTEAS